jgi:hypothetical protein
VRYAEYYDDIRSFIPSGRLLEYEMGEGWAPLCTFLGQDVPAVQFPHKNDTRMIIDGSRRQIWGIYRRAVLRVLAPTAFLMTVVFAICAGRS